MSNQTICQCSKCGIGLGITQGLSGMGHLANIVMVFLTGFLWIFVYFLIAATSKSTRCVQCGKIAKRVK